MKALIFMLATLSLYAAPGYAAPPKDKGDKGASNRVQAHFEVKNDFQGEPDVDLPDDGTGVDIDKLVVPVFQDGLLVNYMFVSVRLQVKSGVDVWSVRERKHYLRDALIRAAHRQSLVSAEDWRSINREKAARVWMASANETLHDDSIEDVVFISADSHN